MSGDDAERDDFERAVEDALQRSLDADAVRDNKMLRGERMSYSVARHGTYPDTVVVVDRHGWRPHRWTFDLWDPHWPSLGSDPMAVATEIFLNCDD